jgi:M6 family metalloprotease-like protein
MSTCTFHLDRIRWPVGLACWFVFAVSYTSCGHVQAQGDVLPGRDDDKAGYPEPSLDFPGAPAAEVPGKKPLPQTGQIDKIVFLVRFRNHRNRQLPEPKVYEAILNSKGGHPDYAPGGSAFDYAREVSYDQFDIVAHVVDWIDLPKTEQYYADGVARSVGHVPEAVQYVIDYAERNNLIDFTKFDCNADSYVDLVTFIHSGYGSETPGPDVDGTARNDRVWSHKSHISPWASPRSGMRVTDYAISTGLRDLSGAKPCRLSLLAHEAAHLGNLPDLYGTKGSGIGAWGLMGVSRGFDGSGHFPPHLSAWSRVIAGWVTPKVIHNSGVYTIRQIEEHAEIYRIDAGFPAGEYLLIENRQPTGFDRHLPGSAGGLAIWHIDEKENTNYDPGYPGYPGQPGWPANNKHYMVSLLQADGRYDLEQGRNLGDADDLFRAGHVDSIDSDSLPGLRPYVADPRLAQVRHRISDISASGPVMTFRYDVGMESPRLAPSAAGSLLSIQGGKLVAVEFSSDDNTRLPANGGVVMEAQLNLSVESRVHIDGHTSVTADAASRAFSTGLTAGSGERPDVWSDSLRLVSVPEAEHHVCVRVNSRQSLPAGQHTIRWVFRTPNTDLRFDRGGSLSIKAFPVQSR